jgi:hypothetical protein
VTQVIQLLIPTYHHLYHCWKMSKTFTHFFASIAQLGGTREHANKLPCWYPAFQFHGIKNHVDLNLLYDKSCYQKIHLCASKPPSLKSHFNSKIKAEVIHNKLWLFKMCFLRKFALWQNLPHEKICFMTKFASWQNLLHDKICFMTIYDKLCYSKFIIFTTRTN